jgi:DNA repair protein RecO
MHHIYHTEGIILGSKNFKEASKYFYILTCDLGLVYAEAQGIRKISSKLRFVLQEFNYVKLDFVQRKNIWRITNAVKTNELEDLNKDFTKLKIVANIARLLLRLLPGIESNRSFSAKY